ncbi:hypothetical protein GUJ93_ZPchr0005g16191 [Zizania palustris]|uniref:Uncharacterized protein n=1 Tax=Zizania palustris TaxID=103762 RepID=A0A8J5S4Q6_ZIZPA|nr:hypothetical protein GUJ93_ZPchr0005g16191 [Zizania palustris]
MEEPSKTEGSSSSKESDPTWAFRSPAAVAARAARSVRRRVNNSAVRHRPYVRKHMSKKCAGALLRDLKEEEEVDSWKLQMERKPQPSVDVELQKETATKDDELASITKVDEQEVGDGVKKSPATKEPRRLPWTK